jgi:diaminopimelate decarboxylase
LGPGVLAARLAECGLAREADGTLLMRGVSLAAIAAREGTPTYVYDAAGIRERYAELDAAFGELPHRICFAVKANANLAVLHLLEQVGSGADIVSGGELLRALAAGFSPDRIVFSGAGKSDEELVAAIAAGVARINVESLSELQRLVILTGTGVGACTIGIRISPDVTTDTHPYISTGKAGLKFGIPLDQLPRVLALLDEAPAIRLGAVAMHLGSQLLDVAPFRAGLDPLLAALATVRAAGHRPDVLGLGGGLGIRYREEEVPLAPRAWIAPLQERLAATACVIDVEPGRYLVGNAGVLLTRVLHRKHSGGREIAIVDAGMNDLLRPALYQAWHEIVAVESDAAESDLLDVVGPVCETGDFIGLDRRLPPLAPGDHLAVLGAGAYGFTMSSNYNSRARATEVLVDSGRWAVVRPRERLADLFRDESVDPFAGEQP